MYIRNTLIYYINMPPKSNISKKKEQKYEKKEHKQHILDLPDTYIGSIIPTEANIYIKEKDKIIYKNIEYIPGFIKIIDEILVNAIDAHTRTNLAKTQDMLKKIKLVTEINVSYNIETGTIIIRNNGEGIDISKMQCDNKKIYGPQMIFGELLTSENYDQNIITGGKNGYGAKLTNIFSKYFKVTTINKSKKYTQIWRDNMNIVEDPIIESYTKVPYTEIEFIPDYERFGMTGLTPDIISLIDKRVYDCSLWFSNNGLSLDPEIVLTKKKNKKNSVKVYLNDIELNCSLFDYINLYTNEELLAKNIYTLQDYRWEVGFILSPNNKFNQVSMVNGITTIRGGKHVDYIVSQLTKKILEYLKKKKSKLEIKNNHIKDNIWVFIKCIIETPVFDGQTKECLFTNPTKFGSKFELSDKFIEDFAKNSGIIDRIESQLNSEVDNKIKKIMNKNKNSIRGIKKLDDANNAGTNKSNDCVLILTEGDSAKTTAIAGIGDKRDKYGCFPLKGKLLNVRDVSMKKISENEEIMNIVRILGLEFGKEYKSIDELRYGSIMIMTDQDLDGSHIKGLFINFIQALFPSLYRLDGFLSSLLTPIVKATKKKVTKEFYTLTEYEEWKENNNTTGWIIKYYKGLGTSTRTEAKEYFEKLNIVKYIEDEESDTSIIKAFSKEKVTDRKDWLKNYDKNEILTLENTNIPYSDFINKDLIHFSNSDNIRSIPRLEDFLKPSQRKVLWSCFQKNLKKDVKVSQLSGYISEKSAYHHGEMSLNMTIINMAQNYVGTNNINLLFPSGQFGTRRQNGKDSASCRYIFTRLEEIAYALFNEADNKLLNYLDDDGQSIEPEFYMPILPLLFNGSIGIGTGYSTFIPQYNPLDILHNIKQLLKDKSMKEIHPWYKGYTGTIEYDGDKSYTSYGVYEKISKKKYTITELPIGKSIEEYEEFLENNTIGNKQTKVKNPFILNYNKYSTDIQIHYDIEFKEPIEESNIINKLNLSKSLSINNMVLYDTNDKLKKYENVNEIIAEFYVKRLHYYTLRKEYLMQKLQKEYDILSAKARFIQEFIDKKIKIINVKYDIILQTLEERNYPKFGKDFDSDENKTYDYLINMSFRTLTEEKIKELNENAEHKLAELNDITNKSNKDLWNADLNTFEKIYKKFK